MKKFLLVLVFGVIAGWLLGFRFAPGRTVVDVREDVVAYADGTAEIVITDGVPSDLPVHTFRLTVAALRDDSGHYRVPNLIGMGSTWERAVYTYDDPESDFCQRNIFYMDRVSKTVKSSRLNYCITESANRDATHFVALSMDGGTVAVGTFEDGAIVATHAVPTDMTLLGTPVFNWEMTKAALYFSNPVACGPDPECEVARPADEVYLWDLVTGDWKQVPLPTYSVPVDTTASFLQYNHDTDTFEYSAKLFVGTAYEEQSTFADKVTELR